MKKESVFVLILGNDDTVLLQHRDAYAPKHPNTWSLWSGLIEEGEDALHAARREVWEELRLKVEATRLKQFKTYDMSDRIRHAFVLRGVEKDTYQQQEGDASEWFSLPELSTLPINPPSRLILTEYFQGKKQQDPRS